MSAIRQGELVHEKAFREVASQQEQQIGRASRGGRDIAVYAVASAGVLALGGLGLYAWTRGRRGK